MSRILHDEQLSANLDALFDVGRDFAQAWLSRWLARQAGDQAGAVEIEKTPAPITNDKRELSVKELAARWGVSTRSIYEWKTTKGLPYIPHGRCLRFDWVEVDAWSKRHRESFTRARLRVVR